MDRAIYKYLFIIFFNFYYNNIKIKSLYFICIYKCKFQKKDNE